MFITEKKHSSKICLILTPDILKWTSWEVYNIQTPTWCFAEAWEMVWKYYITIKILYNYIDIKLTRIKSPQRCNFLWTLWMGWCTGWEVARTSNQDLEEWGGKEGGGRMVLTYICPAIIIYPKGTNILSFYTKWE